MIHDLDPGESRRVERRPGWVLPAVAVLCVVSFVGVATATRGPQDTPTVTLVTGDQPGVLTVPAQVTPPLPEGWEAARNADRGVSVRTAPLLAPVSRTVQFDDGGVLALPSDSYESITRLPNAVSGSTAQEEPLLQYRYRLNDGRFVVLVRVPRTDPLRGVDPSRYIASSLRLRDTDARVFVATGASQLVMLVWTEGIRSYQLSSSTLSLGELASVAELLR